MNGWTIFGIIVILILLGLAITFLVLWLMKKNNNANSKTELSITGLKVFLSDPTTVTATWNSTGNSGNQVTIYADTQRINFDAEGNVEKATVNLVKGGPVSSGTKTVAAANLGPGAVYYVDVVVTNPNIKAFNPNPFTIFTGPVPTTEFRISELQTPGGIELSSDNTTVTYVTNLANKNNDDLWTYDSTALTLKGNGISQNPILYNNNGTLAATNSSSVSAANSQWIYTNDNKWCLKATPDLCFSITGSSPTISVIANSSSQWSNNPLNVTF